MKQTVFIRFIASLFALFVCAGIAAKSNFISLYKFEGKLFMEYPVKYIDRDVLIASGISKVTHPQWMDVGNKVSNPILVRFSIIDGSLFLRKSNSNNMVYNKNNTLLSKAVNATYMDTYIAKYKIEKYTADSSAVVVDVSSLFLGDVKEISPFTWRFSRAKLSLNSQLSHLSEVKSFDDNASVKSILCYNYVPSQQATRELHEGVCSAEVTRTILLLPEEPMKPRIADARVGIFLQEMKEIDYSQSDKLNNYSYAQRWNLIPKDWTAWKSGKLVEPVNPIIFYVDEAFPEEWKQAVKDGILAWNETFEKIGFKEAIRVLDFPSTDPDFDPDNLKYTCVRYVPTDRGSARGPSWVDPRSGEIINASIMVWGNISDILNTYRFVQTAQVDPRVRAVKMPLEVMQASLAGILTHEVGHTLGLAHNMAGSAACPVDSLRSASFTQKYGNTASIMDYAHFNYVAQPEDIGVKLDNPRVGVYDELCIKYLYAPIDGNLSIKEEAKIIEKWLDEKAGNPFYRYGVQQWTPVYDPSTLSNDLGDDPIKASNYGVKNLKYILSNLNKWIGDDQADHRYLLYNEIVKQYASYIGNVNYNIGGIYLTRVKPGTEGNTFEAVPYSKQKASVAWIINELKESGWIDRKEVVEHFPLAVSKSVDIQANGVLSLLNIADNVALSSHVSDKPYTLKEYFEDLYQGIWVATISNKKLTTADKVLQHQFLSGIASEIEKTGKGGEKSFDTVAFTCGQASGNTELETAFSIVPGYGDQEKIDVSRISEKTAYYRIVLSKIKTLLETKVKTAHADDIVHYRAMLADIN
jgi:hypothetical protein